MPIIPIFRGRTHKENESITDCQDYFQINEAGNCFAIADGASQSFYPNIWAEMLVNNFCQNPEINLKNWQTWLAPIQNEWLLEVQKRVTKAETEKRPVWVTNKNRLNFREAATSTFIGLQFLDDQVKVSIVGDSCLFILKGNELKQTYLLKSSKDFNDRPAYFASYPKNNQCVPSFFDIPLDSKKSQDCFHFILATDALSEYIFQCREQEKKIFNTLLKISSQGEFENFVAEVRNAENIRMKNDDVTLITLSCDDITLAFKGEPNGKGERNDKNLPVKNPTTENIGKQQEKENRILKQQRFVLGILTVLFSVFILVDKIIIKHKNSEPQAKVEPQTLKTIQLLPLPKGSIIYKNQDLTQVLVDSLSNSSEVKIIEQQGGWIKVEIYLYAFTEVLVNKECADCADDEMEILPSKNLRVFPSDKSDQDIFGKLKDKSKFKKIKFDAILNWSKFKFVGYIKKMKYPLRNEYDTAVRNLDKFVLDNILKQGTPVKQTSNPNFLRSYNGGNAIVYEIQTNSKKYALKCWVADLGDLKNRYQEIDHYLKTVKLSYFVDFSYNEKGILVNGEKFPIIIMEWVDGISFKRFVANNITNPVYIRDFADQFLEMVKILHQNNISHGDLQHGNIMMRENGKICLIDYDSLYVPRLSNERDNTRGVPGYQHPKRGNKLAAKLSPKSDYFSELIIYLSLLVISENPSYWQHIEQEERLLFSYEDLDKPDASQIFTKLKNLSPEIHYFTRELEKFCQKSDIETLQPLENLVTAYTGSKVSWDFPNIKIPNLSPPPPISVDLNNPAWDIFAINTPSNSSSVNVSSSNNWDKFDTHSSVWDKFDVNKPAIDDWDKFKQPPNQLDESIWDKFDKIWNKILKSVSSIWNRFVNWFN